MVSFLNFLPVSFLKQAQVNNQLSVINLQSLEITNGHWTVIYFPNDRIEVFLTRIRHSSNAHVE